MFQEGKEGDCVNGHPLTAIFLVTFGINNNFLTTFWQFFYFFGQIFLTTFFLFLLLTFPHLVKKTKIKI